MDKKTRLEVLKIREKQLANRETSFDAPGVLKKIKRKIRTLEKQLS